MKVCLNLKAFQIIPTKVERWNVPDFTMFEFAQFEIITFLYLMKVCLNLKAFQIIPTKVERWNVPTITATAPVRNVTAGHTLNTPLHTIWSRIYRIDYKLGLDYI